jgi:hypothetical protein
METLLDELLKIKKGNCTDSMHARSIALSCGVTTGYIDGLPQYRCDRPALHYGQHHVCGDRWSIEWGVA